MGELSEEQQRALAIASAVAAARPRSLAQDAIEGPPRSRPEGVLPNFNRGVANIVGAPVDIMTGTINSINRLGRAAAGYGDPAYPDGGTPGYLSPDGQLGGSASIARGMENIGVNVADEPPVTRGEQFARGAGEASAMIIPALGVANRLRAGSGVTSKVAQEYLSPYIAAPMRMGVAEIGAGGGSYVAANVAQENDIGTLGTVLATVLGGAAVPIGMAGAGAAGRYAGAMIPAISPAARIIKKGVAASVAPFTESGGREIASRRVQSLSADAIEQAGKLEALPDGALERAAVDRMTPAQRTGDVRLMSLERSVLDTDAALTDEFAQRTAEASSLLRQAFIGGDEGNARDVVNQIRAQREYYTGLLEQRVKQAVDIARQRAERLGVGNNEMETSQIVRREIEAANDAAKQTERELWSRVPKDATIGTDNLTAAWNQIDADTAEALRGRIPAVARNILDRQGGVSGNVNEVYGLYSELGAVIRAANARPDGAQTVRFATQLRQAALEDLGAVDPTTDIGKLINEARRFSMEYNRTFNQGAIGRILDYNTTGGVSIPAELTLDKTVGRGGRIAAVDVDQIRAAVGSNADSAISDYIMRRFNTYANVDGVIDPRKANTFMRNNSSLLERYPGVSVQLVGARDAAIRADKLTSGTGEAIRAVNNRRTSPLAAFEQANRGQEISTIFASENPIEAAAQIYKAASRDQTGQAVSGLKNSLSEYLLNSARSGVIDNAGEPITSGRRLIALMNNTETRGVINKIFTPEERNRMTVIANYMNSIERSTGALPNVGDRPITDGPSRAISFVLGTLAARQGAKLGAGTSGASLRTSSMAVNRVTAGLQNLTEGKATQILTEAIQDPDLFRSLLLDYNTATPKQINRATRILSAWFTGTLPQGMTGEPQ